MDVKYDYLIVGAGLFGATFAYEAKKRGSKMSEEAKNRNKKTIFRFIQGAVIGSIVTIIIFYSLTYKEHQRMHDLLEKHGIEKHEH